MRQRVHRWGTMVTNTFQGFIESDRIAPPEWRSPKHTACDGFEVIERLGREPARLQARRGYGNPSVQEINDFLAMLKMVNQASFRSACGIRGSADRFQRAVRLSRSVLAWKHTEDILSAITWLSPLGTGPCGGRLFTQPPRAATATGVARLSHRRLGLTMLAVFGVLLVRTAPNRWGAGIALHYWSRVYWPDPADPIPPPRT